VIPFFRAYDETRVSNESEYLERRAFCRTVPSTGRTGSSTICPTRPMHVKDGSAISFIGGRYIYLPDYRLGRLVETPAEMLAATNDYLADSTLD